MKVRWTERALSELQSHYEYGLDRFGGSVVASFFEDLDRKLQLLSISPEMYPAIDVGTEDRKIPHAPLVLIYRVNTDQDAVIITRVMHMRSAGLGL